MTIRILCLRPIPLSPTIIPHPLLCPFLAVQAPSSSSSAPIVAPAPLSKAVLKPAMTAEEVKVSTSHALLLFGFAVLLVSPHIYKTVDNVLGFKQGCTSVLCFC